MRPAVLRGRTRTGEALSSSIGRELMGRLPQPQRADILGLLHSDAADLPNSLKPNPDAAAGAGR